MAPPSARLRESSGVETSRGSPGLGQQQGWAIQTAPWPHHHGGKEAADNPLQIPAGAYHPHPGWPHRCRRSK